MTRNNRPADPLKGAHRSGAAAKPRWTTSALASAAAAVVFGMAAGDASALALGRLTVLSALGEPLRAEIDVPQISAAEAESLRIAPASPEAFRAAGFEYSSAVNGLQVTLQRRADGRSVLRVSGSRPVNDPFIDLVLEANWSSGRIVRDYTLLFDPPANRAPAPTVGAAPQTTAPTVRAPLPQATAVAPAPAPVVATPAVRAPAASATAPAPASGDTQVTVRRGDTASRIANATKPASVSLDQMLVALLRANPDAFVGGNVNRIRAGAVLDVPDATQAQSTPAAEAAQIVVAQSKDFNDYRRRLAGLAPAVPVASPQRTASGQVQAQVEESRPAAATPDKLTLSKGAVQARNSRAAEERVARDKQASDTSTRMAELSKNIAELNRLNAASGVPPASPATAPAGATLPAAPAAPGGGVAVTAPSIPAAPAAAPATPSAPVAAPTPPAAPTPAPSAGAPSPAVPLTSDTQTPAAAVISPAVPEPAVAPAPAPATPPAAVAPAPVPAPATERSLIDTLRDEPLLPLAIGAILALLAGFGIYRARQRKKADHVDSSFLESRLQPDSFFGASGGQRVDTNESGTTGSSMAYSPSQLDAGGDVDPVAEADVYLAYGRDLQAEEILKEALRTNPARVAIHSKLIDIYNKRRDTAAFAAAATDLHQLTQGQGAEWDRVAEMGRALDPTNTLYSAETEGATRPAELAPSSGMAALAAAAAFETSTRHHPGDPVDLELPMDAAPVASGFGASVPPSTIDVSEPLSEGLSRPVPLAPLADTPSPHSIEFEAPSERTASFDVPSLPASLEGEVASAPAPVATGAYDSDFDFILEENPAMSLDTAPDSGLHSMGGAATEPGALDTGRDTPATGPDMLEFDMSSISLDLGDNVASTAGAELGNDDPSADDPLATKLALAQEFNAIGDADGARALVEEVLAEATGSVKTKAQRLMAELG